MCSDISLNTFGSCLFAFQTSCKTEYRSGIENEWDGLNSGGEQSHLWGKDYILERHDVKVSSLYIAQIKQKHGIIERDCYNKPKDEESKAPQCPLEKEKLVEEALRHFKMVS